ncbi:amidohydrolase family protein [Streptacidiphilus sp. P02-A3a]|uniref:amidohydrolase family protein n=1 Tax=Streptacidiphilus sp. P02-A3a TaxID=2704468 RepID=UPI0015F906E6|nr:amidohydrolase family protein [Streptacidiphilus sp. P02-A3a]QMU70015.1 amidohydrolase [Streptacidiphilus sp. P02-A3a]
MSDQHSPLVDVHSHFVTPQYVAAAKQAGIVHPDGMPGWPTWSETDHLKDMDDWGIGYSVMTISSPGTHLGDDAASLALARHVNDFGADLKRRHPHRFGHFASLPFPDVEGSLAELTRAMDDLGSDGVTLESNAHGVYLGDERYEPLYAELDRRRTPVFVHPTSPAGTHEALGRPRPMLEFIFDSTRTVSDLLFNGVLSRYPNIPWVFSHGGGTLPLLTQRMELFRSGFGLGGDAVGPIPDQVGKLWFDLAGTPFPYQVPALTAAFGTDRVLYGSDYCWTPTPGVASQVASIDAAPQPDPDTWRTLTTRNAKRLLPALNDLL